MSATGRVTMGWGRDKDVGVVQGVVAIEGSASVDMVVDLFNVAMRSWNMVLVRYKHEKSSCIL